MVGIEPEFHTFISRKIVHYFDSVYFDFQLFILVKNET